MPRNLLTLCCSLMLLSACTVAPPTTAGSVAPPSAAAPNLTSTAAGLAVTAKARLDRVATAYATVKPMTDLLIAAMPEPIASTLIAYRARAERALSIARGAATVAAQIAALDEAEAAIAGLSTNTGVPASPD